MTFLCVLDFNVLCKHLSVLCVSFVSRKIYVSFFRFLRAGNFLFVKLVLLGEFIWEAEMQVSIFPLIQHIGHWLIRF